MRNKYGNQKPRYKGIRFDSKKEMNRYAELELMERAGVIRNLQRQVPFILIPTQKDLSGKVLEHSCRYYADFVYEKDGKKIVEDTKGFKTTEYIIKRKLMLLRYGIQIQEV